MSAQLIDVYLSYDACLPVFCLLCCMMSSYLYDFSLSMSVACIMSSYLCSIMPAQLNDVLLPVWCLLICLMSAYLYSVCSTVWCLPTCMTSAYSYYVCLYYVFLSVLWLLNWMKYAYLSDAYPLVRSMSIYLYLHIKSGYQYNMRSCWLPGRYVQVHYVHSDILTQS